MTRASHVECPYCSAPANYGAPFCAYCRAPLTWGQGLDLEPGDVIDQLDFRSPPRDSPGTRRHDGLLVRADADRFEHSIVSRPLRNGCVAVRAVALDPYGTFGAFVRLNKEGALRTAYDFKIYPALKTFYLRRIIWGTKTTHGTTIIDWHHAPSMAPPGTPNDAELRFADSIFQIVINGVRVATVVDPAFGFGAVAWRVGAMPQSAAQVLLTALTIRRVS
jgi:hypothetical protein